ncbi:P1 family peptidase, partial [Mesorhizobium sp. CU2]|uniref:P1 family peptidase n=1 Tax=Mesorhizobium sp. CU2 TaxID=2589985 RepID=UPI00112BBAE7
MFRSGPRNLITDVAGLRVGNAEDHRLKSGVTVVLCDEPAVAGVQVLGGAPGTRETDLLEPQNSIAAIHAVVLSGGSAFGLDAASGVQAALREKNIGVEVGGFRVPIVPAAILFDLRNGGDKDWGRYPPYRELGYEAVQAASVDFSIGTAGAGTGALTSGLKGGLGSASTVLDSGVTIGTLAAVNPTGSVTVGRSRHFWAAPFEIDGEFGGLGHPEALPEDARKILLKYRDRRVGGQAEGSSTTIAVVATDAVLTKAAAKRLAIAAHDGFARAIWPTHTPADGDLVFALATARSGLALDGDAALD